MDNLFVVRALFAKDGIGRVKTGSLRKVSYRRGAIGVPYPAWAAGLDGLMSGRRDGVDFVVVVTPRT